MRLTSTQLRHCFLACDLHVIRALALFEVPGPIVFTPALPLLFHDEVFFGLYCSCTVTFAFVALAVPLIHHP